MLKACSRTAPRKHLGAFCLDGEIEYRRWTTRPLSRSEEISAFHAREWIEHGRLLSDAEEERRLRKVTREAVLAVIDRFLGGASVIVDVG